MRKRPQSGFIKLQNRDIPKHSSILANMYYYGRGVDKDDKVAVKWFHKAAEQGHTEAQDYVDHIEAIGKKASDFTLQTLTDDRFQPC